MKTNELSTCFITKNVDACRSFYELYLSAKAVFDCRWYRGFSIIDPIGNSLYIYSDREPIDEFKQYYKD